MSTEQGTMKLPKLWAMQRFQNEDEYAVVADGHGNLAAAQASSIISIVEDKYPRMVEALKAMTDSMEVIANDYLEAHKGGALDVARERLVRAKSILKGAAQ